MAVLYVLQTDDPNNAGVFPPSVTSSTWYQTLENYVGKFGWGTSTMTFVWFPDDATANTWLAATHLTDATLLADIASWKSAHGISYNNYFYNLTTDTNITNPGIVS